MEVMEAKVDSIVVVIWCNNGVMVDFRVVVMMLVMVILWIVAMERRDNNNNNKNNNPIYSGPRLRRDGEALLDPIEWGLCTHGGEE